MLDRTSGEAVRLLALDAFEMRWILIEGWVGDDTVLLSTRDRILAWHPLSGEIQVATRYPPRMQVDVAINLVRP